MWMLWISEPTICKFSELGLITLIASRQSLGECDFLPDLNEFLLSGATEAFIFTRRLAYRSTSFKTRFAMLDLSSS